MKMLKNKFLIKLLATMCLFLTLFNFTGTPRVYADGEKVWGGVLLNPIINLMTALGDCVMEILHDSIQEQKQAIIKVDGNSDAEKGWALFGAVVIGILAAVAFIALIVVTGGTIAAAAAAITGVAATFTIGMRNNSHGSGSRNFGRNGCL